MRSRGPATIAALYTLAVPAIEAVWPPNLAGLVKVYRGPFATGDPSDALFIGYDGNPDGDMLAITAAGQQWAGIGKRSRDETFAVVCSSVVLSGADDIAAAQTKVYDIFGVVEDLVRADPSLGLGPPGGAAMFRAEIDAPELYTYPTEAGVQTRLLFHVVAHARI